MTKVDYPSVVLLLSRKKPHKNNILVGQDIAQMRFAEYMLENTCEFLPKVVDLDLLGSENPLLFRVDTIRDIDLSPAVQAKTGIWVLSPIEKGSAALGAIIRYAASLIRHELTATQIAQVGDIIAKAEIEDIRGTIWGVVELLILDLPDEKRWPEPWEQLSGWIPKGVDVSFRLNSLYHTLVAYVFSKDKDQSPIRKLGFNAKRIAILSKLNLDATRVEATLRELSIWRNQQGSPYMVSMKISYIWDKS